MFRQKNGDIAKKRDKKFRLHKEPNVCKVRSTLIGVAVCALSANKLWQNISIETGGELYLQKTIGLAKYVMCVVVI